MEIFDKILLQLTEASKQQYHRYVLFFLLGVTTLVGGLIYFIYDKKDSLRIEVGRLYTFSNSIADVIEKNKKMVAEELRLKNALEKKPDFTIKGFFESFCKEQNLTPDQGWDTRAESINEKFDEVVLSATFKGYTTERLVQLLMILDKEEIVYVKEVIVKSERDRKINFILTLATNQYKSQIT